MDLNYSKYKDGLVPAIIQDVNTRTVLMLGFMNDAAVAKTIESGVVTFFSRTKDRLWTKGEESGNFLRLVSLKADCDSDSLLILVKPDGPVCHKGSDSCWGAENTSNFGFITALEAIIAERKAGESAENSYVASLFKDGINRIAQKVGEEAVELVIESKDTDQEALLGEAADLMFHYLILLQAKGLRLKDVEEILRDRHYTTGD